MEVGGEMGKDEEEERASQENLFNLHFVRAAVGKSL